MNPYLPDPEQSRQENASGIVLVIPGHQVEVRVHLGALEDIRQVTDIRVSPSPLSAWGVKV